ncbi:GNAT family N-acetyltransferase [Oricola thermophila]|uniref:GNAT family N-acetyltransferase n=1 Tax=Oricola thermophila TaxID=2742145 RepID=A0A6N1VKT6_9HYPH|nr:GNAT family N-acetyltransferase [Oricola thermophila]QKV19819.1 GNAT family N-acetyltransferase [Oricola thermophila]
MNGSPDIAFLPVTPDDYPMLRRWLEKPHMREWWGETETELGFIRDMVEGRDPTRPFIFHVDGKPLGYIQAWRVGDALAGGFDEEAPWLHDLPADAVGVDLSIGDPENLSRGIGTAVLRKFLAILIEEGHETIVIDPDEANRRAVRAYEKAGFVAYDRHAGDSGVTLLMVLDRNRFLETAG